MTTRTAEPAPMPAGRPEEHRCLTREEAARELRISLYLLDRERAVGRLGYERRGERRVVIPWAAILEYRNSNAIAPREPDETSRTHTSAASGGGHSSAGGGANRSGRKTRRKPRGGSPSASPSCDVRAQLGLKSHSR